VASSVNELIAEEGRVGDGVEAAGPHGVVAEGVRSIEALDGRCTEAHSTSAGRKSDGTVDWKGINRVVIADPLVVDESDDFWTVNVEPQAERGPFAVELETTSRGRAIEPSVTTAKPAEAPIHRLDLFALLFDTDGVEVVSCVEAEPDVAISAVVAEDDCASGIGCGKGNPCLQHVATRRLMTGGANERIADICTTIDISGTLARTTASDVQVASVIHVPKSPAAAFLIAG
jgi:hypothetical protein